MYTDQTVDDRRRHRGERVVAGEPCIVYQQHNCFIICQHCLHRPESIAIVQICADNVNLHTMCLLETTGQFLKRTEPARHQDEIVSVMSEPCGKGDSEPTGGTSDQRKADLRRTIAPYEPPKARETASCARAAACKT